MLLDFIQGCPVVPWTVPGSARCSNSCPLSLGHRIYQYQVGKNLLGAYRENGT